MKRYKNTSVAYRHGAFTPLTVYFLFILGTFAVSCESNYSDIMPDSNNSYISFSTRSQGSSASINTDNVDNEDKVETIRLLIFTHATGELRYNKTHAVADFQNYAAKIPVKADTYDFYFVANENSSIATALQKITFRDELYYVPALAEIPFESINTKPAIFYMTAQVSNKKVTTANSIDNPLKVDVLLVRALAKVSLQVTSALNEMSQGVTLTGITLNNIPKYYSLFPSKSVYKGSTESQRLEGIEAADYAQSTVFNKSFYIPEYLRANGSENNGNTSLTFGYAKHGVERADSTVLNHISFAESADSYVPSNKNELTTYSVIRNTQYTLNAQIKGWDEESIIFGWKILPWTLESSIKDFDEIKMDPPGNFENQPGVEIGAGDGNILLLHSGIANSITIKAKIKSPAGAVWRFSITNTLDFEIKGNPEAAGIASDDEINLQIIARKPWQGYIRSTELYLTVNGAEVQLVPKYIRDKIKSGPGKRYMIQQVI